MSLLVYSEKPSDVKCVLSNDKYFNLLTSLEDADFTRLVLKNIDKAEYFNDDVFKDRQGKLLSKNHLSTGSKTLLNVAKHKDVCFFVGECGEEALSYIRYIKEGMVLWPDWVLTNITDGYDCDIVFNGVRYTNFLEYLNLRYYGGDF